MANTYELVLQIPEIQHAAIRTAYLEITAFLFTFAAISYICLVIMQKLYLEPERMDLGVLVLGLMSMPVVLFNDHVVDLLGFASVEEEKLEELREKAEAYDDYFEVEE